MIKPLYLLAVGRSNVRAENIPLFFIYLLAFIVGGLLLYAGIKTFLKYNRRGREATAQPPTLDYNQPLKIGYSFFTYFRILAIVTIVVAILIPSVKSQGADIRLIIFSAVWIIICVGFLRILFSRLTLTRDELIIKGIFTERRIPINDLAEIYLKSAFEPLGMTIGDTTIVFITKNGYRYKWFCDSFKSLERIMEYIRHFVPDINVEMTSGFKMNRGAMDFLSKPLFQKKESDKSSK